MNLNQFVINRGRGRGKRCARNKNYTVTDMGPPLRPVPRRKKDYTPSSDLNWGKSHISVANTSSTHKSGGSSKISSEEESRVVVALTEGRGEARCEVGIAAIDVSKPLLILCQISDTQNYLNTLTKINIFNPQEILVPLTFVENFSGNRLIDKVKEHFPRIKYTGCARSMFNKSNGTDVLSKLCIPSLNSILLILEHRYYALAAASALITYIQDNLFVYYASGSIKIDYQESEGYAIIDVSTADRLELVCSAKPAQGNKYSSLFGVLNHCQTKIGARTLRSSILQPPCKIEFIEERLTGVVELIRHPEMLLSIQALLQKVSNVDILLSIATLIPDDPQRCSNRQLNYVLLLNELVDVVLPLKDVLAKSKHPTMASLAETLASVEFTIIKDIVRQTIQENARPAKGQAAVMQRCFAIKEGINGLLDLVRKTYSERLNDMREYVKRLAGKYDLPLTLGNNQTKSYHIVFALNQNQKRHMKKSDLPDEFIEVYRLAGSFTMKTPELVNLTTRLDDIMADILKISNVTVHSILVEIKNYVPLFYKLCDGIAQLDVLQSLAECSVGNGYVRPYFGPFTEVTFSHHPLLDFLLHTKPIPNPISCSRDYNVHIITGPNGSGKSIFIRQVMLLQIMAQVGCFVPAQSATFRPADRMYARIYLEDNMEHGASSFILEMKEIKYIMTTMTSNSLVIIDELCRSTSLEEGTALAIAIVEKLAQCSGYIYITTHFTLLTKLRDMYLNVKVWQLETIPSGDDPKTFKLDFRHSLKPGVTSVRRYGVYIVRNIWPDTILKYVDDLLDSISKKPKDPKIVTFDSKIRLKYDVEAQFRKLKAQGKLTVAEINKILNKYQGDLQRLGYCPEIANNAAPSYDDQIMREMQMMEHSVFGNIQNQSYSDTNSRINQYFTPESLASSQMSSELEMRRQESIVRGVFTPEASQEEYLNYDCPNKSFYNNFQQPHNYLGNFSKEYQNSNDSYGNVSQFLAEDSENAQKLVPEVNISYRNEYDVNRNSFYGDATRQNFQGLEEVGENSVQSQQSSNFDDFPFSPPRSEQGTQGIGMDSIPSQQSSNFDDFPFSPLQSEQGVQVVGVNSSQSKQSSSLDDYRFSAPLQNNVVRTSTPINPQFQKSPSPVVHVYSGRNFSSSSNTKGTPNLHHSDYKDVDMESIREDLEVCSRVFSVEDDDFEESLDESYRSVVEENVEDPPKEKFEHVMAVVTVIEGPNDTTISFDEDDFQDLSEDQSQEEDNEIEEPPNKINIISDVLVPSSEVDKVKMDEENVDEYKEQKDTTLNFQEPPVEGDFVYDSYEEDEEMPVSNNRDVTQGMKMYKSFDSTYEAAHTISDTELPPPEDLNESFKSISNQNVDSFQSCRHGDKSDREYLSQERSNCISSGYEISVMDDPKRFLTSSTDKTPNKKNTVEQNNEVDSSEKDEEFCPTQAADKTEVTGISYASKMRKLEESVTSTSQEDSSSVKKTPCEKTITSVSSASRKRNLDQTTSNSTSPSEKTQEAVDKAESSSSMKESDGYRRSSKSIKRKFSAPRSKGSQKESQSTDSGEKKKLKKPAAKKKFIPPRKLSVREIKEEFEEQDRKGLETNPNSSNFSKYLEHLVKRPTVKQIRNSTHLATVRKTDHGVEVIPSKPPKRKVKATTLKSHSSMENFDMSIFSDKNALSFGNYLNSNEKDYKTFTFNFNKNQEEEQKVEFAPTTFSFGDYTSKSVTERLVRTASETLCSPFDTNGAEEGRNVVLGACQGVERTLTPEGFFKQNKEDITRIMNKYLEAGVKENVSKNIFESEIDTSSLNI